MTAVVEYIQRFADCPCGWLSKAYRTEGWAERAQRRHFDENGAGHDGLPIWLLPGETLETD